MELFFNDLSLHKQFPDLTTFRSAVECVMNIRKAIKRFGRELYCHRNVADMYVTKDKKMQQAVQCLSRDQRRAWTQWITRHGPFWEDDRQHSESDYIACKNDVVTETGLGEAACRLFYKIDCGTVSMSTSLWLSEFLVVDWHENEDVKSIKVPNYWEVETLTKVLETSNKPLQSWEELEKTAKNRYPELTFSSESFKPLRGHPFVAPAACQLLKRLAILQNFKNCFDENGKRTPQGQNMYQQYFTGDNAWFSDSSDTEKAKFKKDLTFSHPPEIAEPLFCPWHGKVKTLQIRIHFSWPIQACKPLYIAYVGPKITKR